MMITYTINSRKLGRKITFCVPEGTLYIYVDLNGGEGTLGRQICDGGKLFGETMIYYPNHDDLAKIAKKWWKQYIRGRF